MINAVELVDVSKKYNIYDHPTDRLKELITRNRMPFHREFWALRDINLNCQAGSTIGVIGLNGSGKSTLLQIVANVVQPTSGSVAVRGRLTAILELGAGFQPEYTGRENAMVGGMIQGVSESEMKARMDSIIDFAEIGDFIDQPIKTYSSGMSVRLAFALSILVDPDILVVDEALAVGDFRFQEKCFDRVNLMREEGKTIILVSHDMRAVKALCHKVVLLSNGKMISEGPAATIVEEYEQLMKDESNRNTFVISQAPVAT
jgi:ABC-type polysaccharide/polyol phosphate transport system ATPase subunit